MAENLRFIETLDHSNFDKGIAESTQAVRKLAEDAELANKGIKGMFDTPAMKEAAATFNGVQRAVEGFTRAMSRQLPMKQELRETQKAAMQLEQIWRNLSDAEKQSAAGQELRSKIDMLIQRGGVLKDTMIDVGNAIKFQASDTAKLDAVVGGVQALTAAAQVAAGAMGLLGMSQEDAAKVQKDLIAIMSVVNGLQVIQNALQKESALMMGLSAARTAAVTAATTLKAAVTKADTIATKAAAVAQWAWNAALTANPVGAVVAAVAALAAGLYVLAQRSTQATDAQKGMTAALGQVRDAQASAAQKSAEASLELGHYITQVKNFNGTAAQEKKLLDEINQKYGKQLGYFKSMADAKAHLADMGYYYIKAMEEEAKATALAAAYGDTYAKMIKGEIGFHEAQAQLAKLKDAWEVAAEGAKFYADQIRIANNLHGRSTSASSSGGGSGRATASTVKSTAEQLVKGSAAWYDAEISRLKKLADQQTDTFKRREYLQQAAAKEAEKNLKFGDLGKGVDASLSGSLIDQVNASIGKLQDKIKPMVIPVTFKDPVEAAKEESQQLLDKTEGLRTAAQAAAGAYRELGNAIGGTAGKMVNVAGMLAQAIATMIQGYATATAQAGTMGPWNWIAFGLTGLGQLMAMIAGVRSAARFAQGGIVGGTSYTGDKQYIRVNSGEMILNGQQQARLFSMINSGGSGGEVTFRIAGQQLVGVLNNYNNKMGKVR